MKKFVYSVYTKFVAAVLVVACAVLCVNVVFDGVVQYHQEEVSVYDFEDSGYDYTARPEAVRNRQAQTVRVTFFEAFYLVVTAALLLVYLIAVAGKTPQGDYKPMWVDSVWTEVHFVVLTVPAVLATALNLILLEGAIYNSLPMYMAKTVALFATAVGVLLVLTSLLSIIRKIKCRAFVQGSIICKTVKWVWKTFVRLCRFVFGGIKGFFKLLFALFSKKAGAIFAVMLLVYSAVIGVCGIFVPETAAALAAAIFVFAFACFVMGYRVNDLDAIKRGVSEVHGGNLAYAIPEPKSGDLKALVANINEIATGLDRSVSAKLKAERLKTELITNVSHDLKTPLTSIISYTELLSKVDGLPDEARDYIRIIAKKSDRLKNLTRDLFDISKVQSGNENVTLEKIDVALLINQSLGEHDSEIKASAIPFCVNVDKELYIMADGRKMSRVVSNLISNILKYTLAGTRVFVTANEKDNEVFIEFKNIASYPMDFEADEIVGRFVRGDQSRTAEGNGLGLAIAKSYTEVCGGNFEVVIDGDMFKTVITFPKYN